MAKQKESFLLYHDIRPILEFLDDAERGRLFSALLDYSEYGMVPDFSGPLLMAFGVIRQAMDRNSRKWAETCERRAEAGRKSAALRAGSVMSGS